MYPNTTYYQQPSYQAPLRQPQAPQIQQTQQTLSPSISPFLKGRLVSSLEEARAQTIDFDGSIFYFPDLANRKIYTKQINLDGTSTLNMYELKEIPQNPEPIAANNFVTREEFDAAMAQIKMFIEGAAPAQPPVKTESKPKQQAAAREPYNF